MIIFYLIPWILSLIFTGLAYYLGFSHSIDNFDKVLDAVLTFSSIILGFLGALLGILITIRETPIIKTLFSNGYKNAIKKAFMEPLISGFFIVILSIASYFLININNQLVNMFFVVWLFVLCFFILTSYRLISTLMKILFKSNLKGTPEPNNKSYNRNENKKQLIKNTEELRKTKDENVKEIKFD